MNETEYLNQITASIAHAVALDHPMMKIDGENVFSVISAFLSDTVPAIGDDLIDQSVDRYVAEVLENARALDPSFLNQDPYIRQIRFNTIKSGRYLLANSSYEKGESLQYDFPDLENGVYIPRLGYFTKKTNFPTIYEGRTPWMSVIPSEINTMKKPLAEAQGRMLVLGLGLGYYTYMAARKKNVTEVNVIEVSEDVTALFEDNILPQFEPETAAKVKIIRDDAEAYMKKVHAGDYDGIFADLWQGARDGHAWYQKLHPYEEKLPQTKFNYWIEEYIR